MRDSWVRAAFDTSGIEVDVRVVIVTFRSANSIGDLLESLRLACGGLRVAVIVVDNASDDATRTIVGQHKDVSFVDAGGNIGYGAAINVATRSAPKASATLILNPDLAVELDAVRALHSELIADRRVGIAVPRIQSRNGLLAHSIRREPTVLRMFGDAILGSRWRERPPWFGEIVYDESAYATGGDIEWATGAALAVSAECSREIGEWEERFFLYSEEVDLCRRARDGGWHIRLAPSAAVLHEGGGSGSSPALDALQAINRVRYMRKYGGRASALGAWLALILSHLMRLRRPGGVERLLLLVRPASWSDIVINRLGGVLPKREGL
jgi:GT2 family glycosyltransferase